MKPVADPLFLLSRYNQPAPRYTSYPPAPHWKAADGGLLESAVKASEKELSIYVHIPFCEQLCLYCGCNTVISNNHSIADAYVGRVIAEMDLLRNAHGRVVTQVHWGGGTPTYLDEVQILQLGNAVASRFAIPSTAEASVEIDPRATTPSKLAALRSVGFNRLSVGVQDFDPLVQRAVHRVQSVESTRNLVACARALGFESVNIDLIYGLPLQTVSSFSKTLEHVLAMTPDRIAAFSYAHVPTLKKQQRAFERDLPSEEEKLGLFLLTKHRLEAVGYRHIGIDHFALPEDPLCTALADGSLHRNFQGYTTKAQTDLLGFGVSAISRVGSTYAQNVREMLPYAAAMNDGRLPTNRGYVLTEDDRIRAAVIESILCTAEIPKERIEAAFAIDFDNYFARELRDLEPLETDGLVTGLASTHPTLTCEGRIFSRIVAKAFDAFAAASVSSKAV